jgi:hypothetical protein
VAGLVRDHAHHLERIPAAHQQAGIDENVHSAGDEGVQAGVVDQIDRDRRGIEPRGVEQWRGVDSDDMFDLRIAEQAHAALLGRGRRHRACQQADCERE